MEKITSILCRKESHFHTISPIDTVANALNQMCCENVEYLVVMDDDDRFMGLVTEHDIATGAVVSNKSLLKTKVMDIMNKNLPLATTEDTVEKCMQLMRQHHTRWLPVFEGFIFKGIVTNEDILDEAVYNRMEIFDARQSRSDRFGMII
jgi:CBS domain-containing protein